MTISRIGCIQILKLRYGLSHPTLSVIDKIIDLIFMRFQNCNPN